MVFLPVSFQENGCHTVAPIFLFQVGDSTIVCKPDDRLLSTMRSRGGDTYVHKPDTDALSVNNALRLMTLIPVFSPEHCVNPAHRQPC